MKFTSNAFLLATAAASVLTGAPFAAAEEQCSHGKLYVSDAASTMVHVFDAETLGQAPEGSTVASEHSVDIPQGKPGLVLNPSGQGLSVGVLFRGTEELGYTDGIVTFLDTGLIVDDHGDHMDFEYETSPAEITNAAFSCSRPIHWTPHDDKIAIFCDGNFGLTAEDQANSTIWVVDESLFGDVAESAIVFQTTLLGTHHGVAVPVDDNHILYSLPTQDRVDRTELGAARGGSLPATFRVTDYQGNERHAIADTSDPDMSCAGFHGEWAHSNQMALACDATHGGILRIDYDANGATYTSRALTYPPEFENHRTGTFAGHDDAGLVIGNFAGGPPEAPLAHLMAFDPNDAELTADQIFTLPASHCAFAFEKGEAHAILVMLPTGDLHVLEYEENNGGWNQLAQATVLQGGVEECSELKFVAGVQQAFLLHKASQTLHVVDLAHVEEGELETHSVQLDFVPSDAVVSGVTSEIACKGHDHEGENVGSTDGAGSGNSMVAVAISASLAAVMMMIMI